MLLVVVLPTFRAKSSEHVKEFLLEFSVLPLDHIFVSLRQISVNFGRSSSILSQS